MSGIDKLLITIIVLGILISINKAIFFPPSPTERIQQPAVETVVLRKCTRCEKSTDVELMKVYATKDKKDIYLCPDCVYAQAEMFIRFCPIDE